MIDLKDITKVYLVGEEEVCALDHVTMHVYPGDFVSVIGPSGSGKSTLMNVVGCLDTADAGNYVLDGIPIEFYSDNKLAEVRNRKIGFVFQNFNLITNMTVEENIELPLIYRGMKRSERVEKVKAAVAAVGLQTRVHHLPTELSGGQQQRVAIARAIVTEPSLILADEPTGNLDSHTSADIIEIFKKLNALGNTIVLITHDPDIAAQAKRVIRIKDGKVSEVKADGNS
ncbi:MAG: ABC transporter ATP-binding protein [Clostridiales bacterium]|nr:ABC transporter ATP-binding protein [Clostridiales bacterium]